MKTLNLEKWENLVNWHKRMIEIKEQDLKRHRQKRTNHKNIMLLEDSIYEHKATLKELLSIVKEC